MVIVFWQNVMSQLQVETLKALAKENEVYWYVDEDISEERKNQGWGAIDRSGITYRVVSPDAVASVYRQLPAGAWHFLAPRGALVARAVFPLLKKTQANYGLLFEIPNGQSWKFQLSKLLYYYLALLCRKSKLTLAMGELGRAYYSARGFPNVHSFGYTVQDSTVVFECIKRESAEYKFICVAQLIHRKQQELILRALAKLKGQWSMTFIGRGSNELEYKALSKELGIESQVEWLRSVPNAEVRNLIAHHDTHILASSEEGWGAVVNEALAEGTRVIVSDAAGASCLCQMKEAGDVFSSGCVESLYIVMDSHIAKGQVDLDERLERAGLHEKFNGVALASYMGQLIQGAEVSPPWLNREEVN